jgi:hypothetical protein
VGIVYHGSWSIVGKSFYGTVPYANFEGMDVGAAMKELALISMSYFKVDVHGHGIMRGRAFINTSGGPALPEPFEEEDMPLWEGYRSSIEAAGETEAGVEVKALVGDTGDSAHREEFSSVLITSEGMAYAVALQYLAFHSIARKQIQAKIPETAIGLLHNLDQVELGGIPVLIYEAEHDLQEQTYDLKLVEVKQS